MTAVDWKLGQHVEWAGVGRPRRAAEGAKRGPVDDHWELTGLLVGHTGDAQSCPKFAKSGCEAFFVGLGRRWNEIEVVGLATSAMKLRAETADHHVFDGVAIEGFDDPCGIEAQIVS